MPRDVRLAACTWRGGARRAGHGYTQRGHRSRMPSFPVLMGRSCRSHQYNTIHRFFSSTIPTTKTTTTTTAATTTTGSKRFFTRLSPLQILTRPVALRPQLPFLHPRSGGDPGRTGKAHRSFLTWYLTPTRKARWRQTLRRQVRFHAYLWPTLLFVTVFLQGIRQAELERMYPSPREWSFWQRWALRNGAFDRERCEFGGGGAGVQGWSVVGRWFSDVLARCELDLHRARAKKGDTGNEKAEGLLVEGVGELGAEDLSSMSEPWKRGYHQALMGAAKVAEHLDGMARRKGDNFGDPIPYDSVVGPNNPRPKPLPWDKKGLYKNPPKEDEVEDAFSPPEKFYMRILTNREFTDAQRLDAAIAYADYLDFKGLWDTAGDMYDWALDIAAGGLPMGANDVINIKTGIINTGKDEWVSENILKAATAMGVHCAKKGDVKAALPIFLSVLRARRGLPPASIEEEKAKATKREQRQVERGSVASIINAMKGLVIEAPYPPTPPTGNERPSHSLKEACEEVGLMTYIGEILFATSNNEKEKGLSWTRDSVGAVEAILWVMEERGDDEGKERCQECLETGLENWQSMTRQMVQAAKKKAAEIEENNQKKSGSWLPSIPFASGASALTTARQDVARWQEEETQIELRKLKTASLANTLRPTGSAFYSA